MTSPEDRAAQEEELLRVVCSAGRNGWDGVSEAVMAYGAVTQPKAQRFIDHLAVLGYQIIRLDALGQEPAACCRPSDPDALPCAWPNTDCWMNGPAQEPKGDTP